MAYKDQESMVNDYIKYNLLPYKTTLSKDKISYNREFYIQSINGIFRYDLMIINPIEKRYDVIEFKKDRIKIKDVCQVQKYMNAFLYNMNHLHEFIPEYKYCFHLIGQPSNDEMIENIKLFISPVFKIHYCFGSEGCPEIYIQEYSFSLLDYYK